MSRKNIAHESEVATPQSKHHGRELFIAIIVLLGLILAVALFTVRPRTNTVVSSGGIEAVSYNTALEMQYAQPWLDKQAAEVAPAVPFNNDLALEYAQSWIDKHAPAPTVFLSDALAMEYARPWLNAEQAIDCNGRLDLMYACQNGYKQP